LCTLHLVELKVFGIKAAEPRTGEGKPLLLTRKVVKGRESPAETLTPSEFAEQDNPGIHASR